jgi:pyruvate dehydrogenase E2 component (dihydrolipoamide acetyltransferase)
VIEFRLPSLGADMDDGTLLEWKVKPGDAVKKGQVVAVVDTTKAAVDVEIWQEGTVAELLVKPPRKIPVGTVLATLLEPGEIASTVRRSAESPPAAVGATATPAPRRRVSPAARKRARELGIEVDAVAATGPENAVTLEDVENASHRASPPGKAREFTAAATPAALASARAAAMRRTIAAAMARSKREIPHYYVAETIPMERALAWLGDENARRPMAERILAAALLVKAVAVTLAHFPELNGIYRDGDFEAAPKAHVGIAISLRQGGLVAPALLDAAARPLPQLMRELGDLVQRARAGSLRSSELSQATITVTNLGDEGSEEVFGVIYPPQVALVGFGRILDRPWVADGAVRIMPAVTASLSADHRVSDGHRGARFLAELRERLQRPQELEP